MPAARQYAKQITRESSYQLFDARMHHISLRQMQTETELRRPISATDVTELLHKKFDAEVKFAS